MRGPPSGGTVDWMATGVSYFWGHKPHDVLPYELAVRLEKVSEYYQVRPSW